MTREEFIKSFKEMVVEGVYWNLPKEYRKSDEYTDMDLDEQFDSALDNYAIKDVLIGIAEHFYEKYEEDNDY